MGAAEESALRILFDSGAGLISTGIRSAVRLFDPRISNEQGFSQHLEHPTADWEKQQIKPGRVSLGGTSSEALPKPFESLLTDPEARRYDTPRAPLLKAGFEGYICDSMSCQALIRTGTDVVGLTRSWGR